MIYTCSLVILEIGCTTYVMYISAFQSAAALKIGKMINDVAFRQNALRKDQPWVFFHFFWGQSGHVNLFLNFLKILISYFEAITTYALPELST